MQKGYFEETCEEIGVLWRHDGLSTNHHVSVLINGTYLHYGTFFRTELILEDPLFLERMVQELLRCLLGNGVDVASVDRVVGLKQARTIIHEMARQIGYSNGRNCFCSYLEEGKNDADVKELLFIKSPAPRLDETVLVCGDVYLDGSTYLRMASAVREGGSRVVPCFAVLFNGTEVIQGVTGFDIVAVMSEYLQSWTLQNCPYCKKGSLPYPTEIKGDWKILK